MAIELIAVFDAEGVGLFERDTDNPLAEEKELPWPKDWPEVVSLAFLISKGYQIKSI